MAASFLALAAARRSSRVRVAEEEGAPSSSEEDSSEEDSASEDDSAFLAASRGSCKRCFSRVRDLLGWEGHGGHIAVEETYCPHSNRVSISVEGS